MSSGVCVSLDLAKLPLLPGALELSRKGNLTRASKTNRSFSEKEMTIKPEADPELAEFAFDAQTSGGLLAAVKPGLVDSVLAALNVAGYQNAACVGEVIEGSGITVQ